MNVVVVVVGQWKVVVPESIWQTGCGSFSLGGGVSYSLRSHTIGV